MARFRMLLLYICRHFVKNSSAKNHSIFPSYLDHGHTIWLGCLWISSRWLWASDGIEVDVNSPEWIYGQPDNGGGSEGCMCYAELSAVRGWNDASCYESMPFICQIAIP